jgi:hypothetical protein
MSFKTMTEKPPFQDYGPAIFRKSGASASIASGKS